jgi:hypothetical protein
MFFWFKWSALEFYSLTFYYISNHSSNISLSGNKLGNKKFNNDHNSWGLFYNGVPVKKNLYLVFIYYKSLLFTDSSFLSAWASSTIRYV